MPGKPASAFVQESEIRLVINEQRFVQFSLDELGRVMDRPFTPYVPIPCFVQIALVTRGRPLRDCDAVNPPPVPSRILDKRTDKGISKEIATKFQVSFAGKRFVLQ